MQSGLPRCAGTQQACSIHHGHSSQSFLKLADHHIGITHGGDGCSRRILDFDRDRAIALGEAALKEAQKDADKNESRIMDAVACPRHAEVPDPLPSLAALVAC